MNPLLFACVINIFILLKLWSIPYKLTKEIEVDETYVTHCRKGRKIEGHPGKKRGTPARKRGLSEEKRCENKILVSYKSYDSVNHLNNVNSFHSQIQAQYTCYKGISSKYINRYNALFALQREYLGMDSQEMLRLIMKRLRKIHVYFYIRQIRKECLFPFAIV